jgi:hypothetical protein
MQNTLYNTFPVPHNIFEDEKFRKYKHTIKLAYVGLLKLHNRLANKEGWFWRSGETLSKEIGMDIKTYWYAKNQLVKDGYIEVRQGEYNPEKNARHALWYKVNGFLNPGEKIPEIRKENQQVSSQENIDGVVTKIDLERNFLDGGAIFKWLMKNDYFEEKEGIEGHPKPLTDGMRTVLEKEFSSDFVRILAILYQAQEKTKGIVSVYILEKEFPKERQIFDWLIQNGFLERISDTKGRVKTDVGLLIATSKVYPEISHKISEFLEQYLM